jgi:acetylglutamate kinase
MRQTRRQSAVATASCVRRSMDEIISKAATLLEALPYIQRFRSQIFVVKYGGSFMDSPDPEIRHRVARDVVFLEAVGINPVVVHGGGKAITRAVEAAGVKAKFVQGHRVTDAATAEIVDRVLSREINPEIVQAIEEFGGKARGFPGTEIFRCRKLVRSGEPGAADLGFVGDVYEVNVEPLRECIRRSITPVVSPTARGDDGEVYNCNADLAAAKTAIALKARRLVFMSDVPGLLRDPKNDQTLMTHLAAAEVPALKDTGIIDHGMIPKVDSAVAAIESGVEKVQFVDGRIPHSVLLEIFTDAGVGTEVVLS